MNKLILGTVALAAMIAGPAMAADMPVKAPPPAGAAVYNWTGFYVGANAGYGWGNSSFALFGNDPAAQGIIAQYTASDGSFHTSGFIGGGQLGSNWQVARNWLAGIEADIDYANVRGSSAIVTNPFPTIFPTLNADQRLQWLGTLRGRLGILPTDRLLIFATGGLAYGRYTQSSSLATGPAFFKQNTLTTQINCNPFTLCLAGDGSRTSAGWTLGAGAEYALWNNISFKAEYLYVRLSSQSIYMTVPTAANGNGTMTASFNDPAFHIVRAGINIKFAADPIVAKY
jgi:outer membrane immunogenic protein